MVVFLSCSWNEFQNIVLYPSAMNKNLAKLRTEVEGPYVTNTSEQSPRELGGLDNFSMSTN